MEEQTMSQEADSKGHVSYTSSDRLWSAAEKNIEESSCPASK